MIISSFYDIGRKWYVRISYDLDALRRWWEYFETCILYLKGFWGTEGEKRILEEGTTSPNPEFKMMHIVLFVHFVSFGSVCVVCVVRSSRVFAS